MSLTRCEFEILSYLESKKSVNSVRCLSDDICISGESLTEALDSLQSKKLLYHEGDVFTLSEAGIKALEPYRVKKAIVVGAGFGSRMMPATANRPKPMVTVNGVRIIDTLLDALVAVGITDITVVGGYHFEVMKELLEKYPYIRLLNNTKYSEENNISSALLAMDYFHGGCYFCEADLLITNKDVIKKYQYASNILGSWSIRTDDWCFKSKDGCVDDYKKGGRYCYNYYGISFWTDEDASKLKRDWAELYAAPGGKALFWEFPAFVNRKENYNIEIRPCRKQDIIEIDSFDELASLDPSYLKMKEN